MRWQRFFLLIFLFPILMHGLNKKECEALDNKIGPEWERHTELLKEYQKAPYTPEGLALLKEALACCQRARTCCNTILSDIANKSKSEKKVQWVDELKQRLIKEDRPLLKAEIAKLEADIEVVEAYVSAVAHYKTSLEKASEAQDKDRDCQRAFNNVDEVVSALNESAKLYEEALSHAQQALVFLKPYTAWELDKITIGKFIANYQELAKKYKKEALEWPATAAAKRADCKAKIASLKADCQLLMEKGLKRGCYELQRYALSLLEQLVEGNVSQECESLKIEQSALKEAIAAFEKEADLNRLTEVKPQLTKEEFETREKQRRELFFKSEFLLNPDLCLSKAVKKKLFPRVIPLDGQTGEKEGEFTLYADQFYRFLIQAKHPQPKLTVKVLENGRVVHIEQIPLPFKNTKDWDQYLRNGMIFIPETRLKIDFGLELRLSYAADAANKFSLIIAQRSIDLRYQFSFCLGQRETLYTSRFLMPPPWQLEALKKPALSAPSEPIDSTRWILALKGLDAKQSPLESIGYPILNQFIEEHKNDPLALASFVQNEIALVDPFLHQENGVIHPISIQRNPATTFLEKQGSALEQCQLLVYLLRQAGFNAGYALGAHCSLPKDFVERMFLTKLPEEQQEAVLKYPWVLFSDGKEWVSLFPWMKDMQIQEGYDLYSFLPEKYATAHRWILQYLKGDEEIVKHIGPDGDDTAGVLFVRFVEEHLRKQGLSLSDVGIHRTQLKKQFSSWEDFPHPTIQSPPQLYNFLPPTYEIYTCMKIDIYSKQNPKKLISKTIPVSLLAPGNSFIRFTADGYKQTLFAKIAGQAFPELELDIFDKTIDVAVHIQYRLGTQTSSIKQTYTINKGTSAALCFHFGSDSPQITSQCYEQFKNEKDEKKKLLALLSFVGSSYFEKCSRSTNILAALHKVNPTVPFGFGLAKLSPDLTKGPFRGEEDLILPQVDMFCCHAGPTSIPTPPVWHQELQTARTGFEALCIVDGSSNEHHILREVFKDDYAVSTVKLLQLAYLKQQRQGLEGEGFLTFTPESFQAANKTPDTTQKQYFPYLNDVKLSDVKTASSGQWNTLQTMMDPSDPWSYWTYAYMTPGLVDSIDGTHKEMGTLIISPYRWYALISINDIVTNGGLGAPLPSYYFTSSAIRSWELIPTASSYATGYTLQVPALTNSSDEPTHILPIVEKLTQGTKEWTSDVRAWFKDRLNSVADPIDIVSGAFYIDEIDLVLPGPFPLTIRRNYNSQNPLMGGLGCGWKLSLNPFLVDQDGKRFAAELDGTVIVYCYNRKNSRWEVSPEENPELSNFNQQGIGSSASPFHSYIEDDVLYGADGSKRYYQDGLLQKWVDVRGNTLSFFYKDDRLSRIESSNGDFCGIHYNHGGNISEIYAKDGRRISYDYDSHGDLIKVTLPNTAEICYTYDRNHRVIRETKPHGKVLENIYDDEGRVKQQRSPMGPQQEMVPTATFEYAEGKTIVTDAQVGKTIYQIHDKLIYKITDPLGFITLQAWFIDKKSWFDPETAQVVAWDQKGGAIRSLKSTTDKRGLITSYLYDGRGNPEIITLEGEDLTGNGEVTVTKKLAYNERNLCVEEEVCGQKTLITYDPTFTYLPKRIEKYCGKTLVSYIDFSYNSLGQLEKEDRSGAITIWKYNDQGFPRIKTQMSGTDDPDVLTLYSYNRQGQCIEMSSVDGTQEAEYDLMGNQIVSRSFSLAEELMAATYTGYDLNSAPIWIQTANSKNIIYFDYHASGLLKAKRQSLAPSHSVACSLYGYNACGYLTEETDPRGYVTYRDYDLLGRVRAETKEGHATFFSYEAGGLVKTITSPSGAQVSRHYTTNGLLKEEIYPDGTKNETIYDLLGRPVLETKNGIAWEISYDDAYHRVIRTHRKTGYQEISEFDQRGNLIRFTDAAGFSTVKTYDGLNRLKSETTPSGKQTLWNYQNDRVICTLPSGEITTTQYAAGRIIKSETLDSKGSLIAVSHFRFDPKNDTEEVVEGDKRTITWRNTLGLPIKIEKGHITVKHEYDACGNCIFSADGDSRITHQTFDGLGRLSQKQLPDGSVLTFIYDRDSNLTEYHLPNGNIWKASYDAMQRKKSEEIFSSKGSLGHWAFLYEEGYLVSAIDPMQRTHSYLYDDYGRLYQDRVDDSKRVYSYDPRGFLATADQTIETNMQSEHSLIERSYDEDGNLNLEAIYLNANLHQQTNQKWSPNSRSLEIGSHKRDFIYQNNQLVQVSTPQVAMGYSYDLGGALKSKNNRFSSLTIDYNISGLPETILTRLPEGSYKEQLEWYPSGKLYAYTTPGGKQSFAYNERGYLKSAGSEKYEYDFGSIGIGVRTAAPGWYVPQDGLDDFGRILVSLFEQASISTEYNEMGEVITYGQKQLSWDPWGRLIKVIEPSSSWEASYDAFGRRLQTRYTKSGEQTLITNSFYDPEEEFQEIGIQTGKKTFWKIYGPDACDAISDETGASVILMHNALSQLTGIVSSQGTLYREKFASAYGPQEAIPSAPSDLITYAESLNWHSKAQDPTGFIWMGDRYYDSHNGQFLRQDSVSYPNCLNLYTYANGDPINYFDPDGRWASPIYQPIKATVLNVWYNPRFQGSLQAFGGLAEVGFGGGMTYTTGGLVAPAGWAVMAHGLDHFMTGMKTVFTGRYGETATSQLLRKTGMSHQTANFVDSGLSIGGSLGSAYFIQRARVVAIAALSVPESTVVSLEGIQGGKNFKSFTRHNYRENLIELTGVSPSGKQVHAHHVFAQQLETKFLEKGINIHDPKYLTWWEASSHQSAARQYNLDWIRFMRDNPGATQAQILQQGKEMMAEFGITTNY